MNPKVQIDHVNQRDKPSRPEGWNLCVGQAEEKLLLTVECDEEWAMELHIAKEEARKLFFDLVEIITNRGEEVGNPRS